MHPTGLYPEQDPARDRYPQATLYASLELSRSVWLVTSLAPGSGKMSKHSVTGGDGAALLALLARLRGRVARPDGESVEVVVVQEAGRDGFWVHRLLEAEGVESRVVDPGSVAAPRRARRAKTDAIDGETLLRTLPAGRRGEPRVCAMVRPPSPEEEDRRRTSRERGTLLKERVRHTNRIKGLLATQGVYDFEPLGKDRRAGLEALRTGDGRPLPARLRAELRREGEPLELGRREIAEGGADRAAAEPGAEPSPFALLKGLKGIGPQIAAVLYHEGLYRSFANRREVAALATHQFSHAAHNGGGARSRCRQAWRRRMPRLNREVRPRRRVRGCRSGTFFRRAWRHGPCPTSRWRPPRTAPAP